MDNQQLKWVRRGLLAVVVMLIFLFANPLTIINAGHRGVVLRFGAVNRILDEGIHVIIPFPIEIVKEIDVRNKKEETRADAASKDLQTVEATIALNYNLIPNEVGLLWKEIGRDYKQRVIDPSIQESVKAAMAQYNAEELITERPLVREQIKTHLKEKLSKAHINVIDVSIVNFNFSQSFDAAIEAKVTAEQSALEAKNKLEEVKFEAQQKIEKAIADAEAIRIQARAIAQQGGRDYVQLQAIAKWDGKLPTQFVPNAAVPFLNLR